MAEPRGLFSAADHTPVRLQAHIEDALTGNGVIADRGITHLVDIGSGGGIPGIPLVLSHPTLHADFVESRGWKASFLRETATALGLADRIRVVAARAEECVPVLGREAADAMSCRALAAPMVAAEYGAPLVRVGGVLLLWSTQSVADAFTPPHSVEQLGLSPQPVVVPARSSLRDDGVILVWEKTHPTSERFPRRAGVASRNPLS